MPSKYIRKGFLQFYKSTQERDWQQLGYYNNWVLAIKFVPVDTLVSFMTPVYSGINSPPTTMKIRRVKVVDNEITVLTEQTITSGLLSKTVYIDENITYYYRNQGPFTSDALEYLTDGCIYDIYIEDSAGNMFISEMFVGLSLTDLTLNAESGQPYLTEDGQQILYE